MLSVLIPVYNYDVSRLISDINAQCINSGLIFEIIVVEDGSSVFYNNSDINKLQFVKYEILENNVGRSKIRNILADKSKYENLIYMDCDSELNPNFIRNYIEYLNSKAEYIVCGGRNYTELPESNNYILHWTYGIKQESKSAKERNLNPNKSFMTNNFLISKALFNNIRFNEEITTYGHEDTLFGYELKKKNILINHIDNQVVHIGLETNLEFLEKTKQGLDNLLFIYKLYKSEIDFINNISLLKTYNKFKFFAPFINLLYRLFKSILERNILGNKPNMKLFSFYKLGYFCGISKIK